MFRGRTQSAQNRQLMPEGRLSGPMPWVIAIMVFLTVLAAAAALTLSSATTSTGEQLSREATVQILAPDPAVRDREQRAAQRALVQLPQIVRADAVPPADVEALLAPWFGGGSIAEDIPLPALIDVTLARPVDDMMLASISAAVLDVAPSARIDADSAWLEPVLQAMQSLQWLAAALILLLAIATAATVVLAARSALGSHSATIAIVHLLGGTDLQISRLFQRRMALDATFGSVLGFLAGAAMLVGLSHQLAALETPLLNPSTFSPWLLAPLLGIPVITVLLAMLMARLTILGALRKML